MTSDPLDLALQDLFAVAPREGLWAGVDARVGLATASVARRPAKGRLGRRRLVVGLLAATFILVGAGGLGLYAGLGGGLEAAFDHQLSRSVAVGATEVHDGYRVTIDRAYLDGERLMLGILVTDELERPEVSQLMAMYAEVTDANGEWQGIGVGTSSPIGQWSSVNMVGRLVPSTAPAASSRQIHIVMPHIFVRDVVATPAPEDDQGGYPWHRVTGPWTFDVALAVDGAAAVADPDAAHTIGGVAVALRQVVVGPAALRLDVAVDDPTNTTWSFIGEVRRGDRAFPIILQGRGSDGVVTLQADGGTDNASGDWSLVITEATRSDPGDGAEQRFVGPWTFDFQIP